MDSICHPLTLFLVLGLGLLVAVGDYLYRRYDPEPKQFDFRRLRRKVKQRHIVRQLRAWRQSSTALRP